MLGYTRDQVFLESNLNFMRSIRVLFLIFVFSLPVSAGAAELVMFESPICDWCTLWHKEVGVIYDKTPEARQARLRRVDIDDPRPEDLTHIRPVVFTPTFVLMQDGRETGRITGYPGEEFFWQFLGEIITKIDAPTYGCLQPGMPVPVKQATPSGNSTSKENAKC